MTLEHWRGGGWDRLRIGGKVIPGRVKALDFAPAAAVSVANSKGVNGPRMKSEGYLGSPVEADIELWSKAHLAEIESAIEQLQPSNADAFKQPLRIDHPLAYIARVEYIASAKLSVGMPANGRWSVKLSMMQWFPAEEKTKAAGTTNPANDTTEIDTDVPEPDPANIGADFP
jgi:hypothetical protein